jgi:plastocyanin
VKPRLVLPLAALCAALALAATGCGSSKKSSSTSAAPATQTSPAPTTTSPSSGGGGAAQALTLSADPNGQFKFDKSSLTAKAGTVTLDMTNPSSISHAIAVKDNGVNKVGPTVNQGGTSKVTVTLKPGTYTFYCPVDGHASGGMKGTLTVK